MFRSGPRARGRKIRYSDIPKYRTIDGKNLKFIGLVGPRATLKGTTQKYQNKGYSHVTMIARERNNKVRTYPVYGIKKKRYKKRK